MELAISSPYAWLIIAALFVVVEILTPSFGPILLAVGALCGALLAYLEFGWVIQILGFSISSILALTMLRPRIAQALYSSRGVPNRTDEIIGKVGVVTESINPVKGEGRVMVDGQDWAAEASLEIAAGENIRVQSSNGIRLIVTPERRGS
ncbi:MAG: NfeD family protein [Oligoflexia bacterium]|nr:NfeD family protein [Oligoflexia bacterium]